VEEQRVQIIVDITSPPEETRRLGDSYRVEARFLLWKGSDVLQVPTSALFHQGDDWAVFVVEDGKARQRTVRIGRQNGLAAQILEGLEEGEIIIEHPEDAVAEGVRVQPE
jgi:HlyD family secretion protein